MSNFRSPPIPASEHLHFEIAGRQILIAAYPVFNRQSLLPRKTKARDNATLAQPEIRYTTMTAVGALLKRALRSPLVFSSSTDVGKTVVTTLLCKTASKLWRDEKVWYLKPVSTGPLDDADARC